VKRALVIVGAVLILAGLIVIALPLLFDANQFRPLLESKLTKTLGRQVKLENLKLSVFSGGVTASSISIADDPRFSKDAFLSAQSLTVRVQMMPFIVSRKLLVKGITIDEPSIAFLEDPSGHWNFATLGAAPQTAAEPGASESALDLSAQSLKVTGGKVVFAKVDSKTRPEVFENVSVEIQDFSTSSVFPFTLEATGSGGALVKMQGKAGPLNSADLASTPLDAALNVTHLDLARSGFLPATGFAGIVSIQGDVSSTGQQAHVTGKIQAEQLVLARRGTPAKRQVTLDFDLHHDLQKHAGTLDRGDVRIGAARASLTGNYHSDGPNTILAIKLSGPAMPLQELEAMLPALDIVLPAGSRLEGGTASANATLEGPTDRMVLDGTLGLNNTRLTGFDLGSQVAFMSKLAGLKGGPNTEIQSMRMNVHVDPSGIRTENMSLVAPQIGDLTGAGSVSAEHVLDFKMVAKIHASGLLAVVGSNTTVPFRIQGTSSAPKFEPDLAGIAVDKLKDLGGSDVEKAASGLLKGFLGGGKK
jgi:AsmA protein